MKTWTVTLSVPENVLRTYFETDPNYSTTEADVVSWFVDNFEPGDAGYGDIDGLRAHVDVEGPDEVADA